MEETRLPPPSSTAAGLNDDDKPDDPPSTWHRPTSSLPDLNPSPPQHIRNNSLNISPNLTTPPLPPISSPDPVPELETYVVHVPRNQIYWTPPPEHAKFIENRQNKPEKHNNGTCSRRVTWFLLILIIIGFIVAGITIAIHFAFKPTVPVFAVQKLNILKPNGFEITLNSKNPTSNMKVSYKPNGIVSLMYKNKKLGRGKFPKLSQAASESNKVTIKLDGSAKNAAGSAKSGAGSAILVMEMNLKMEYEAGPVKRNKEVVVTCDVKVKGLLEGKKIEIVSEKCESEFKS